MVNHPYKGYPFSIETCCQLYNDKVTMSTERSEMDIFSPKNFYHVFICFVSVLNDHGTWVWDCAADTCLATT